MNTTRIAALATVAGLASAASAQGPLLLIDLSVTDQITITATSAASAIDATGSDGIGVYLDGFYSGPRNSTVTDSLVSGDLTNVGNASDGSPNLFTTFDANDSGLNIFSWSPDTDVTFTAGQQAFQGSATWTLDSADYADMLAGNTSGDLYFPADDAGDLAGAGILGTWSVIPAPSGLAVLGLGGLVAARRRR